MTVCGDVTTREDWMLKLCDLDLDLLDLTILIHHRSLVKGPESMRIVWLAWLVRKDSLDSSVTISMIPLFQTVSHAMESVR